MGLYNSRACTGREYEKAVQYSTFITFNILIRSQIHICVNVQIST